MVVLRKQTPHRMRVAGFLSWHADDLAVRAWQLTDGEPVAIAPVSVPQCRLPRSTVPQHSRRQQETRHE
jgi:hypothetical protein